MYGGFSACASVKYANTNLGDLSSISSRSRYFYERLTSECRSSINGDDLIESAWLSDWRDRFCGGDDAAIGRRLHKDINQLRLGFSKHSVRPPDPGDPSSSWTGLFAEATAIPVATTGVNEEPLSKSYFSSGEPLPFQEILYRWIEVAAGRLSLRCRTERDILAQPAWDDICRQLLLTLVESAGQVLLVEYDIFRSRYKSLGRTNISRDPKSNDIYKEFLNYVDRGGLRDIMVRYPVLARVLSERSLCWIEANAEFISRLHLDRKDIQLFFCHESPSLIKVEKIRPGLSDPHNHGRTVSEVFFSTGNVLFYKPRNPNPDRLFYNLVDWCNKNGLSLPLKKTACIFRETYGWYESIEHQPCSNVDEVRRYYHRSGSLLCLMYILGGHDLHAENLIASSEYPMIVDLETLLYPDVVSIDASEDGTTNSLAVSQFYTETVFRTNLLPRWEITADAQSTNSSGLVGGVEDTQRHEVYSWEKINRNDMRMRIYLRQQSKQRNRVYIDGHYVSAEAFVKEITEGFYETYMLLMKSKITLLSDSGPFSGFKHASFRFIIRHTRSYTKILTDLRQPCLLNDGMNTSLRIDTLAKPFLTACARASLWGIIPYEHNCLHRGDIPIFYIDGGSRDLVCGDGTRLGNYCTLTGAETLRRRLNRLSELDRNLQCAYIRSSLCSANQEPEGGKRTQQLSDTPLAAADFEAEAILIASDIEHRAISADNKSVTWITRAYDTSTGRWQLQLMDYHLYDGLSGTALFLASIAAVTSEARFRSMSLKAYHSAIDIALSRTPTFGGCIGTTSLVYALAKGFEFLADGTLLMHARNLVSALNRLDTQSVSSNDILTGLSGSILCLLALHKVDPARTEGIDLASRCGDELLSRMRRAVVMKQEITTPGNQWSLGFAHGITGIAFAFAKLYDVSREQRFHDIAFELFHLADTRFQGPERGWSETLREMRNERVPVYDRWCNGSAGIGLAGCGSYQIVDGPIARRLIDQAVECVKLRPIETLDHVCCGSLGQAELLLSASEMLSSDELRNLSRAAVSNVVGSRKLTATYALGFDSAVYIPSFYQGMSGIGYQLLRTARPSELPSVLLWD